MLVSLKLDAQPLLNVVYSEKDSIEVGDEFTAYLFLENVNDGTSDYDYASMTLWMYYDNSMMQFISHSLENSFVPDLGTPYFSENFNKNIPKGSYGKLNFGFYRATKVNNEGLILSLKMKALKAGSPKIRFSYAEVGGFQFKEEEGGIVYNDSLKIVEKRLKKIDKSGGR